MFTISGQSIIKTSLFMLTDQLIQYLKYAKNCLHNNIKTNIIYFKITLAACTLHLCISLSLLFYLENEKIKIILLPSGY